jgi:outer membrane protein assembly factor BamA
MQHGETGAQLPRALARQRGKEVVQMHNGATVTSWLNRKTGKSLDRTGTFEKVNPQMLKKRLVSKPV